MAAGNATGGSRRRRSFRWLPRWPFRRLLLAGFLLVALLPSGALVRVLLTLETLAQESRQSMLRAVQVTRDVQLLGEQALAMERSARQYLLLEDGALLSNYRSVWLDAQQVVQRLDSRLPSELRPVLTRWQALGQTVYATLSDSPHLPVAQHEPLFERLQDMNDLSRRLADASQRALDHQHTRLLDDLEAQRKALGWLVVAAAGAAGGLALIFGMWLARPVRQLEQAIDLLGGNRLEQPVVIHGPADLHRLGRRLDWLRQRLAELEADQARFLRHVSHELKTPLAALREGVALLQDEIAGELNEPQREVARILSQNTVALQLRIEDLLRYNAVAFDARLLQRKPHDLHELVDAAITGQRLQWQAKQLTVVNALPSLTAAVDAEKLGAVFDNLLSNAIRFSPEGGTICFDGHLLHSDGKTRYRLDCRDEGPGVAPQDAARVFEPFFQGARQPPSGVRGSGIGLSIVREYVLAHGGTASLLPSERGAHFRIELPDES